jgi:hypothetical protein
MMKLFYLGLTICFGCAASGFGLAMITTLITGRFAGELDGETNYLAAILTSLLFFAPLILGFGRLTYGFWKWFLWEEGVKVA